jgi:hypothetical protein
LTKDKFKGKKFERLDIVERAFKTLKAAVTSAPILKHIDPRLPTVMETTTSYFTIRAI